MTTVTRAGVIVQTIPDPSVRHGRRVVTRVRLADNSTASIELSDTPCSWLKSVTPIKLCKHGHIMITETTYIRPNGSQECITCRRIFERRRRAKHHAESNAKALRYYRQYGRARRKARQAKH